MTDRDAHQTLHIPLQKRVILEEGGGWADGEDRIWSPSLRVSGRGEVSIPIQHHEEEGAAEGVEVLLKVDGTTQVRGDGRVA
jgi:hypothetical protein